MMSLLERLKPQLNDKSALAGGDKVVISLGVKGNHA